MIVIERAVVGRKTPGDGKLEVSAQLALALGGDGTALQVHIAERKTQGTVTVMPCTCEKAGKSGKHEHHFVQCDDFRTLPVGSGLRLQGATAELRVSPA